MKALSALELKSAATTLTDMGLLLLTLGKGRDQNQRVTLGATLEEISLALEDRRIFSEMLPNSSKRDG
jgi:hypothetical protein